jgi:hypothetical protein
MQRHSRGGRCCRGCALCICDATQGAAMRLVGRWTATGSLVGCLVGALAWVALAESSGAATGPGLSAGFGQGTLLAAQSASLRSSVMPGPQASDEGQQAGAVQHAPRNTPAAIAARAAWCGTCLIQVPVTGRGRTGSRLTVRRRRDTRSRRSAWRPAGTRRARSARLASRRPARGSAASATPRLTPASRRGRAV